MLEIKNLTHGFDYNLFEDISFSMQSGDIFSIVGSSGCGKSTLLNILSSFQKPNGGVVKLFGEDIYSIDESKLINIIKNKIGIIFQSHYLFKGFTARENLEVSCMLTNNSIDMKLLERLGIDKILNQQIGELSGGQQQRLSIARVLMKKPSIIFADEPTGNLDSNTSIEVMNTVFDYVNSNEALMVLVTHDLDLANRCNKVLKLDNLSLIDISN
jgi:putative ABC transport system ATP-binding protein